MMEARFTVKARYKATSVFDSKGENVPCNTGTYQLSLVDVFNVCTEKT